MVQSDIFHGKPAPVEQGQIIAVLWRGSASYLTRHGELIYCRAKATFLMVHLPVDSLGRRFSWLKATFPMVQRQKSDVFHSTKATTLMDSGASNGDIFHGPTAANLFNRFLEDRAMATFFIVQGRQAFNSSKTGGKKSSKSLTSASTQTLHLSLWSLTKSRRVTQKPKQRFSLN
jgi:hypothetical protein